MNSDATPPDPAFAVGTDATAAVPQPTLRATLGPDECEVLLVRHGRSADVVPGSAESSDPPLHPDGVAQAEAVARRLAPRDLAGVYSSHLRRAVQTAEAILVGRDATLGIDPELEEYRMGDWGNGEFRRRAAILDPEWVAWSLTGRWDGIPGSEGDDAFRRRVREAVDRLVDRHAGSSIAVVAHGGAINAYVAAVLGTERSLLFTCENTSITTVRVGPAGASLLTVNDCHHLYDPLRPPTR
jgi:probable phosphoglycerate mutase